MLQSGLINKPKFLKATSCHSEVRFKSVEKLGWGVESNNNNMASGTLIVTVIITF